MRRLLAGLLLLSLLVGQVRMIGALIGRYQARQQMQQNVESVSPEDEANVQHLRLSRTERQSSNSSFVRVGEEEFQYRGNLYDVVREEWRGDVWHVWAVHDRAEEHYLEVLEGATAPEVLEGDMVPADQRAPVLRPLALIPTAWSSLSPPAERDRTFPPFSFTGHPSPVPEVPHPPPWA